MIAHTHLSLLKLFKCLLFQIGTVYDRENNLYEIFPINHGRVRRSTFDSNKNTHLLVARNKSDLFDMDNLASHKDYGIV